MTSKLELPMDTVNASPKGVRRKQKDAWYGSWDQERRVERLQLCSNQECEECRLPSESLSAPQLPSYFFLDPVIMKLQNFNRSLFEKFLVHDEPTCLFCSLTLNVDDEIFPHLPTMT
ncbi:unnamed protein product [Clavelina lepadiformis]|uniref:Uncharacterized protein n=1 Tax=Clavelina lepadiformis TaxID=159417 RepID=A0ABP0FIZ9_CLALP